MSISRHLANLVDGHAAGPDGYVRLAIDASVWTALAAGCAAGLHDLCALWADGGAMRMALSDSGRGLRAIVSLQTSAGQYPSVAAHHPPYPHGVSLAWRSRSNGRHGGLALEDGLEPVGRVANFVPVEAGTRVDRFVVGGDACDQARQFANVGVVRGPQFDFHGLLPNHPGS